MDGACGFLIGLIVGAFLFGILIAATESGPIQIRDSIRAEAIEAGVAEYRVDPKTGETSFHWLKKE